MIKNVLSETAAGLIFRRDERDVEDFSNGFVALSLGRRPGAVTLPQRDMLGTT